MPTLKNIFSTLQNRLNRIENAQETEALINLILEHILGISRMERIQQPERFVTTQEASNILSVLNRLENHEPIQYILGEAHFYDLMFDVNPLVLIPRQETEELVHWIIQDFKTSNTFSLLDIGSGSGCIPIALKKNLPKASVFSCDISVDALHVARQNAIKNEVDVHFFTADVLSKPHLPLNQFDVMVSNPPYVTQREKQEIKSNVLENEPHLALFVSDDNPLIFYIALADMAKEKLSKHGFLYLEINQYLGAETCEMLHKKGFKTELRKDLNGNDRMIKAWF